MHSSLRSHRYLTGLLLVCALAAGGLALATLPVRAAPSARPLEGCPDTTPASAEAIGRAYIAAFNSGDLAAVGALLGPDFVHYGAIVPTQGRELHLERLRGMRAGFPDAVYSIPWLFVDGDAVVMREEFHGTNLGAFIGLPATGRPVAVSGLRIMRIVCGQIVESRDAADLVGLYRQLGVIPGPPTTPTDQEVRTAPRSTRTPCPATTPAQNIAAARRWYDEALNQRRFEVLDEILAPGNVHHGALFTDLVGREPVRDYLRSLTVAFPDVRYAPDAAYADGDRVLIRWSGRAAHLGELYGIPPTGVVVEQHGMNAFRFECGEIVESWSEVNGLEILRQIGAFP